MTKEIRITVTAPIECTEAQFEEWVRYCVHDIASIPITNPLHEYDMEAEDVRVY